MPGSSGDSLTAGTVVKIIGGNNECHCVQVGKVIKQVDALEKPQRAGAGGTAGRADPFTESGSWNPG